MTDAEAARLILQWFYDRQDDLGWHVKLTPDDFGGQFSLRRLHCLIGRLYEGGLISATYSSERNYPFGPIEIHALGIKTEGINEIEGTHTLLHPMTFDEIETRALTYLNENRGRDRMEDLTPAMLGIPQSDEGLMHRVLLSLHDDGFIRGTPVRNRHGATVAGAEITKEGSARLSPPAPTHQTINVSGGYVQVGNYNTQNVDNRLQAIVDAILASEMEPGEKAGALKRLGSFLASPGLGNALQGAGVLAQALGAG